MDPYRDEESRPDRRYRPTRRSSRGSATTRRRLSPDRHLPHGARGPEHRGRRTSFRCTASRACASPTASIFPTMPSGQHQRALDHGRREDGGHPEGGGLGLIGARPSLHGVQRSSRETTREERHGSGRSMVHHLRLRIRRCRSSRRPACVGAHDVDDAVGRGLAEREISIALAGQDLAEGHRSAVDDVRIDAARDDACELQAKPKAASASVKVRPPMAHAIES